MRGAYSQDLRMCVLTALDQSMSKIQAHRTFGVSRSTIDDWVKFRAATGQVAAKRGYYRGRRPLLEDTPEVRAFVETQRDSTLSQMAEAWFGETGQRLSIMTFSTTLRRLGYTRKKRVVSTKNATPKRGPLTNRKLLR